LHKIKNATVKIENIDKYKPNLKLVGEYLKVIKWLPDGTSTALKM